MATVDDRIRAALAAAAEQVSHRDPEDVFAALSARRVWPRRLAALATVVVLVVAAVAVWRGREDTIDVETGPAAPATGESADKSGWEVVTSAPFPPAAAVWAADRLAIWGAHGNTDQPEWRDAEIPDALGLWHPDRGWSLSPAAPMAASDDGVAVWTGHQVVVIDNRVAAAYSPEQENWAVVAEPPPSVAARPLAAVWTGQEVVVWGDRDRNSSSRGGAAWDPEKDRWRVMPEAPAPINQGGTAWINGELVVVGAHLGSSNQPNSTVAALAYSPGADTWRRLASPDLSPQASTVAATAEVLIAWDYNLDAVVYDASADAWEPLASPPFSSGECYPDSLAIPSRILAFFCGAVAAFDTRTRQWATLSPPTTVIPSDGINGPPVWDGRRVLQVAGTPADLRLVALTPDSGDEPICHSPVAPKSGRHPDNRPLTVTACAQERATAGEPITLEIRAHDPDAPLPGTIGDSACDPHNIRWGDEAGGYCVVTPGCNAGHSVPAQEGEATYRLTHTYTVPGIYRIDINVMSGSPCEFDWSDTTTLSLTVEVR